MPVCLICKKEYIRPLAHAWQKHKITSRGYKMRFGLDLKKSITTEEDKAKMRKHVFENGTVENLKNGAKCRFKKGQSNNYQRSPQTMERLQKHWQKVASRKGAPVVEKITITCALCGKAKKIYPRYYQENNNYCGVVHRNIANNKKKNLCLHDVK